MHGFGSKGLYFRILAYVVRLVQGHADSAKHRLTVLAAIGTVLIGVAWIAANTLVLQAGELAGTAAYDRLLFSYLMRLICAEAFLVGGIFLSALWAQQAGRIPQYAAAAEERD